MIGIFSYDRRKIGIERADDSLSFLVTGKRDLDLALYYIESHPEVHWKQIKTNKVESIPVEGQVEQFIPQSFPFKNQDTMYSSNNYVLLDSGIQHGFSEIAMKYASFFQSLKDQRRKKVTFLDFDYEIISLMAKLPYFNPNVAVNGGITCRFNRTEDGNRVNSIMFQAQVFTKGLKRLFGHDSRFRLETNLEERITF